MSLVVMLKGINVGGRRRLRPTELVRDLRPLEMTSIGSAGTFVVHGRTTRADLRREIARRLPFRAEVVILGGREVLDLVVHDFFAGQPPAPDVVRFVGALARRGNAEAPLPLVLPETGPWLVRVIARHGRFVIGVHRRRMAALGALGRLEGVFGSTLTIRSWSTMERVSGTLRSP